MKKSFFGLIFAFCAFLTFAETNTWVSGSTDWRSADSYVNESGEHVLPGANDFILIPQDLKLSLVAAEDFTFLSGIRGIFLRQRAQLTVQVPSEGRTLGCAIRNYDVNCGTVIKTGEGVLSLSSPGNLSPGQYSNYTYDYQCGFDIREGDIRFFSNGVNTGKSNIWALFSTITVAEGCKAYFPTVDGQISPHQIFCKGDFVNEGTSDLSLTFNSYYGAINEFSGKLIGKWNIRNTGGSRITGIDNRYPGAVTVSGYKGSGYIAGTLFLTAFGAAKDDTKPSSIGTDTYISLGDASSNAQLIYLGEGETVDKTFGVNSSVNGPFVMDAGAHGGLNFQKPWRNFAKAFLRGVITGSNTTECVIDTKQLEGSVQNGINCNWQITKRGSGTWRIESDGTKQDGLGMIAVEEGTLRFNTLKGKGTFCSLGYGTNLFENLNTAAIDESKRVPYAYRLGGTANAVFEYTGADLVRVADRPIGLSGGVSHVRSSGSDALRLRHAGGIVSGTHTLVLDGTNECENVFSTITNGVGTVNVVKDGSGSWTLAGEQSFSGTLEVKDGTLTLLSPKTYSFYKWIFKEVAGRCPRYADKAGKGTKNVLTLGDLALYDANGNRQNLGITDAASMSVLAPGTATYDHDSWPETKWQDWGNSPAELFNGYSWHVDADGKYVNDHEFNVVNFGTKTFVPTNETSWMSIVCRLTNATPEIASYDIGYKYGYNYEAWGSSTALTAYEIRGSVDGLVWDELATDDEVDVPAENHKWLSDKSTYYRNAIRKVTGDGDCIPLRGKPVQALPFLSNITGLIISGGATVQASCPVELSDGIPVTIDASSGKTASISGLVFGSSGTLEVINAEKGRQIELPVEFKDDSYVNLANYDLVINGKANASYKVTAKDGKLTLMPPGLLLIVK